MPSRTEQSQFSGKILLCPFFPDSLSQSGARLVWSSDAEVVMQHNTK